MTIDAAKEAESRRLHFAEHWKVGTIVAQLGLHHECFERASVRSGEQAALRQAFSCYYSGNFQTGFDHGYVQRVIAAYRVGHRNVGRTLIDSSETATSQQSPSKRTSS